MANPLPAAAKPKVAGTTAGSASNPLTASHTAAAPRSGSLSDGLPRGAAKSASNRDGLNIDSIKDELKRLSAANQALLQSFSGRDAGAPTSARAMPSNESIERLTADNSQLKARIRRSGGPARTELTPESWTAQQQEFEQLLDEKSEIIRTLNHKIHELSESGAMGQGEYEQEKLQAWAADLAARDEQIKADEEAMQMQVLARDGDAGCRSANGPSWARQKALIDRQHADLDSEVEVASRDPNLRDRLRNLQRSSDGRPRPSTQPAFDPTASQAAAVPLAESRSVLRRLFGG